MNILVLGGGGREHAIAWALAKSPRTDSLYVAPGNGGTDGIAQNVPDLNPEDGQAVLAFVRENAIDFVVIGPEAPLVAGVADVLRAAGVPTFGPDAQGAQLEGSKTFSKKFMDANDIPTARYASFTDLEPALAYVRELGAPIVVKADGLAAGKGVVVADELEDAEDAVRSCFDGAFGDSGKTVLIEECLTGPECSMLAFVSDGKAHCMATAQDHKRAFDGDRGPNTGGMGAYSPVPIVTPDELAAMHDIMERAAVATAREFDNDYRGVLYGGFMLTPEGPKIIVASPTWRISCWPWPKDAPTTSTCAGPSSGPCAWCWPAKAIPDRTRRARSSSESTRPSRSRASRCSMPAPPRISTTSWSLRAAAC